MLINKSYNKWRKKYAKFNHEILYTKFLIKKVTPYSERTTRRTKNFTPNLFFSRNERYFTRNIKILIPNSKYFTPNWWHFWASVVSCKPIGFWSFFKMIYLWMKAIENIFNHFIWTYYYPTLVLQSLWKYFPLESCVYSGVFPRTDISF